MKHIFEKCLNGADLKYSVSNSIYQLESIYKLSPWKLHDDKKNTGRQSIKGYLFEEDNRTHKKKQLKIKSLFTIYHQHQFQIAFILDFNLITTKQHQQTKTVQMFSFFASISTVQFQFWGWWNWPT